MVKSDLSVSDLGKMSVAKLNGLVKQKQSELALLKFELFSGKVKQNHLLKKTRRLIARANTQLTTQLRTLAESSQKIRLK